MTTQLRTTPTTRGPRRTPRHRPYRRARGYTLLELMLVLAILLVLAALSWPRVEGLYERHRLQEVAETVRLHLAGSRLLAIDEGVVFQFRYQLGGQAYEVVPLSIDPGTGGTSSSRSGVLPASMTFAAASGATSAGGIAIAVTPATAVQAAGHDAADAYVPILFFPDGTADDAALDVVDGGGRHARLTVRGLTAAVTVTRAAKGGPREW